MYPLGYLHSKHKLRRPSSVSPHEASCLIALGNCLNEAYDPIQTVRLKAGLSIIPQQVLADSERRS